MKIPTRSCIKRSRHIRDTVCFKVPETVLPGPDEGWRPNQGLKVAIWRPNEVLQVAIWRPWLKMPEMDFLDRFGGHKNFLNQASDNENFLRKIFEIRLTGNFPKNNFEVQKNGPFSTKNP